MLMGMFMMENGKMIRQMEREYIYMLMGLNTKETGRMISNMEGELKTGQIMQNMMENIEKEKSMEEEF